MADYALRLNGGQTVKRIVAALHAAELRSVCSHGQGLGPW